MAGGWKDTIRNVAPALGRALGLVGVPGATALAAVSQALLGKPDGTEAEVASRVANWQPADGTTQSRARSSGRARCSAVGLAAPNHPWPAS